MSDPMQRYVSAKKAYVQAVATLRKLSEKLRKVSDQINNDWPSLVGRGHQPLPAPTVAAHVIKLGDYKTFIAQEWVSGEQIAAMVKSAADAWKELEDAYNAIDPEFRKSMEGLVRVHDDATRSLIQ